MTADITFGFSSYSFHSKLSTGEMTLPQVIDWVARARASISSSPPSATTRTPRSRTSPPTRLT